ncbi:MAG: PKD domain-containing protein [Thermoplasmata archaeon]
MVGRLPPLLRHALLALVVALVALTTLTSLPGAQGASPNYVITGQVTQPNDGPGVPSGVTVQLTSSATHAIYTTTTAAKGIFTFNSANTNGTLAPGWWGLSVQPQGSIVSTKCPVGSKPPGECAVLPASSAPQYYWESAANLTTAVSRTITDVTVVGYTTTINATVKIQGTPVSGATVQLISPNYPGVALSENTTNATGVTTFLAPSGSWLLYTEAPGSPNQFNYTALTIPSSGTDHVAIVINNNYVFGSISSSAGGLESAGFNQTLIDTSSGAYQYSTYSQYDSTGYSYSVGAYPAGFSGSGAETFQLILSPIGYSPAFVGLTIPADAGQARNVVVTPIAPPAVYNTTLNYTTGPGGSGFGLLNVTTVAKLGNYSVFPDLANASVGQLWGQLALDFAHTLTLSNATFASDVLPWIQAQGPFFPAGQDNALINGTGFGQPTNYTTQNPNPGVTGGYAANYGLTSAQGLSMSWHQVYNVTSALPKGGTGTVYNIAFNYRHPTNGQSINYTVVLPKGFVLKAGTAAPPGSILVPAGPGSSWTKFYLDSKPSVNAFDTANFTLVKYGNISARVNVSVPTFTFSTKNVLNDSRTNYSVVVGLGENVTFSAINSTYPAGINGSAFAWHFGDGGTNFTSQPTTHHIYTSTGAFVGTLNVTSSGGLTNQISFTVYVGDLSPTAYIQGNWTAAQNQTVNGAQYIIVNWSTSLQFNLTGSASTLYAGAPYNGVISVAVWNLTSHNFTAALGNFSAGAGANTSTPVNYNFQGAGNYLHAGLVSGNSVSFLGWQYNLTLTVWDGQGHSAKTTLVILVRDTQKPLAVILAYNAAGNLLPSSGTVEGPAGTAYVRLTAKNSTDPHNGTITGYTWYFNNTGNSSVNATNHNLSWAQNLAPQQKPYTVNLTVTDEAGYIGYTIYQLTVAYNTTTRPILTVTNMTEVTGQTAMTAGTSYTWWVNITNNGGKLSTARNVQLALSLTSQTATAPGGNTAGTPGSVKFYNVTAKGVVGNTTITGPIDLVWNQTVRAEVTFSPTVTGTKFLWANATCGNQYVSGANIAHVAVTVRQNQTQLLLEYAAIGVGAVAVIVALLLLFRHRKRAASAPPKSGGRLERGGSSSKSDKDDDEDDDT